MHANPFSIPVVLEGSTVRLEPLSPEHVPELTDAVGDGQLWNLWYTRIPAPDAMAAEVESRLQQQAAGSMAPWAIRRLDTGALCGMTTYMNIKAEHRRVEIGSTWLAASAQRTSINAEAKYLLLSRAFEDLDCIAVEFRTHWHNHASRAAIARLGAKQDGVLRSNELWLDGSRRDVVVFSILEGEWSSVRLGLRHRLRRELG
ncbi:GNAT family N-acetyltransferase [Arthrobacter koreensis]|uniref:GNAT family N-acetyltransferase n=1 Tax=Arthrobacter koreensis TaxID=199136 RepID=A0ABY6FVF7_9MICC|nr:GNAT family protein [Arthrobacter koreensis]UYB36716.1 GNAT family N-acetyltransferase [Arthrobacter koreensis]